MAWSVTFCQASANGSPDGSGVPAALAEALAPGTDAEGEGSSPQAASEIASATKSARGAEDLRPTPEA
jgi:hypothetical protein